MAKNTKPVAAPVQKLSPAVSFDVWWAITSKKIPAQHKKEIIAADFKARGLSNNETLSAFNTALDKYGVNIK